MRCGQVRSIVLGTRQLEVRPEVRWRYGRVGAVRHNRYVRNWTFWIGVVLGLLGLALPEVGVPRWLAWAMLGMCVAIMVGLVLSALFSRYWTVQVQRRTDDPALPPRDDRRDLADDLDVFANRMADWLDARAVKAPSIIDANTAAILGQSRLSQACASRAMTPSAGRRTAKRRRTTTRPPAPSISSDGAATLCASSTPPWRWESLPRRPATDSRDRTRRSFARCRSSCASCPNAYACRRPTGFSSRATAAGPPER